MHRSTDSRDSGMPADIAPFVDEDFFNNIPITQTERENIRKRQAEGIAAAKMRGVKFGRPKREIPAEFLSDLKRWERKEITIREITEKHHISERTFYRRLREIRSAHLKI